MKYTITLLFVSFSLILSAQNTTFIHKGKEFNLDARVEQYLGAQKVAEYKNNSTFKLFYFNFFVQNSYEFIDALPNHKNIQLQSHNFSSNNPTEFDILKEGIESLENNQYFAFGSKYLLVYSQNSFNQKFDKYIQSLNQ